MLLPPHPGVFGKEAVGTENKEWRYANWKKEAANH
jgi:hypothetical protein